MCAPSWPGDFNPIPASRKNRLDAPARTRRRIHGDSNEQGFPAAHHAARPANPAERSRFFSQIRHSFHVAAPLQGVDREYHPSPGSGAGDILLDELEPDAGHLNQSTVLAHEELTRLENRLCALALLFRKEFIHGPDLFFHARNPIALFHVHLNRGVCSLPVILFLFDAEAWEAFQIPLAKDAAAWNAAVLKLAKGKLEYSRRVKLTGEDYFLYCRRKDYASEKIDSKARFLLRAVQKATADELQGIASDGYRPIQSRNPLATFNALQRSTSTASLRTQLSVKFTTSHSRSYRFQRKRDNSLALPRRRQPEGKNTSWRQRIPTGSNQFSPSPSSCSRPT